MERKRERDFIIFLVIAGCLVMAWVDGVLCPGYGVKSLVKILLFLILPLLYCYFNRQISFRSFFSVDKKGLLFSLLLGVGVYFFIIGTYLLIGPYFDFQNVTAALERNVGVNKQNFLWTAIYISFVNSLLEEFYFRGFAFLTLHKMGWNKIAYFFSAGAFALYHVAMMTGWFSVGLFLLLIFGLLGAGILFDWLDVKQGTIYTSWMVHMFANFAINTVGFMLFDMI